MRCKKIEMGIWECERYVGNPVVEREKEWRVDE